MVKFDIKPELKNHYLFEYPINQLIHTFILIFEKEKEELMKLFLNRLTEIYGEPKFSNTIFNISNMIVYKYFNDDLALSEKAFLRQTKFNNYPFSNTIKELEPKLSQKSGNES